MKENKLYKWLDNFWYHYKWIVMAAVLLLAFVAVSTVQMFTREKYDMYVMYAGPEVLATQNTAYIKRAFERIDDNDFDGDGKVNVGLRDVVLLSQEELAAAQGNGNAVDVNAAATERKLFGQEIFGGDAVICLLSPYAYEMVHEAGGFMTLEEVFGYIPESAYDECGILLCETDFGKYNDGLNRLPEDTLLCIRKTSTMSFLKGQSKTEKAHDYSLSKFKAAIEWENAADLSKTAQTAEY